ncbi:MAG: LysM peptidoglycan-binding domain-containing protein, partial [Patescibacteria group bacterium]|nr:LysM peptidoglycan-binding domain-containing protein [Patescibacteria group bacterium]
MISGVDVSQWQGVIDWPTVKRAGYQFALIRATVGMQEDTTFKQNWTGAKAAGLAVGAYHFAYDNVTPADQQADFFHSTVVAAGLEPGDLAALDMEVAEAGVPTRPWNNEFLGHAGAAFGCPLLDYSDLSFLEGQIGAEPGNNGLWLAEWTATMPATPAGWPFIAVWQHTNAGAVAGINGRVDLDFFNVADMDHLLAYGYQGHIPPPVPSPVPPAPAPPAPVPAPSAGDYIVRPGDYLSAIAWAHHCTLQQLESINPQILNPNLIY